MLEEFLRNPRSVRAVSRCYLELNSGSDGTLYGPQGELLAQVTPQGELPLLQPGANDISFSSEALTPLSVRAKVTVIRHGEALEGSRE